MVGVIVRYFLKTQHLQNMINISLSILHNFFYSKFNISKSVALKIEIENENMKNMWFSIPT